jgi:hypothetical protein
MRPFPIHLPHRKSSVSCRFVHLDKGDQGDLFQITVLSFWRVMRTHNCGFFLKRARTGPHPSFPSGLGCGSLVYIYPDESAKLTLADLESLAAIFVHEQWVEAKRCSVEALKKSLGQSVTCKEMVGKAGAWW